MNKNITLSRSYLFVPANRIERFEKALNTAADAIIIDLEDAIPAHLKNVARKNLKQWLLDHPEHKVMIRINPQQTEWFNEDVQLSKLSNVIAIVLPKVETPEDIQAINTIQQIDIFPIIETPLGFSNVRHIASTISVQALMFGTIDFQLEMDMQGSYLELLSFRNEIVLASKLAGISSPIDGVTVDFKNEALLKLETLQAKKLGFTGKLCIHPNQIQIVNEIFTPSTKEIEWAQKVLLAVDNGEGQAVSLDGKMIDLPIILKAKKLLQKYELNN
jgi:citrate lyase subunit beta / citryl-CoA lyase